ncbi:MAG: efflux RND transporter periplasmic adaptor subunit [Desulfofustis sp.]|nr:efflux RND transporter periplasmic adaptor subunit [Desulfofustis sp.]
MKRIIITSIILAFSIMPMVATSFAEEGEQTEFEGLIEPFELVNVGTAVEGVVENVAVERSALVEKGQPLVQLESSVENTVVKRAMVLAAVEGELELERERLAFAERMHKRVEELFQGEAISAEKRDEAATEVSLARARLHKAKENRALAMLDLERVEAMLNRRTIKSPIAGVVVERFVSPGEFVDNKPLLTLAQMDPLRVEVILPANMLNSIKPGMKAKIKPETDEESDYTATVSIVDRVIDPASGTFGVRLELPNPDYQLPGGLKCQVFFDDLQKTASPAKPRGEEQEKITANLQ